MATATCRDELLVEDGRDIGCGGRMGGTGWKPDELA